MKHFKNLIIFLFTILSITACKQNVQFVCDEHYINGFNYLLADNLDQAKSEFELSIKNNPENAYGYYGLGYYFFNAGENKNAISTLDKAIEIKPDFTLA
jgi:tetratricopeptide (TPR) repeat protein